MFFYFLFPACSVRSWWWGCLLRVHFSHFFNRSLKRKTNESLYGGLSYFIYCKKDVKRKATIWVIIGILWEWACWRAEGFCPQRVIRILVALHTSSWLWLVVYLISCLRMRRCAFIVPEVSAFKWSVLSLGWIGDGGRFWIVLCAPF